MRPVVCRVAPSPTGTIHPGTARTALYSFLHARQHGGTFIIRMEDTDLARSTQEFADNILDGLQWLGISSDVEIVYQSKRNHLYQDFVEKLLSAGVAYKCYCSAETLAKKRDAMIAAKEKPMYDRTCYGKKDQPGKPYVVRVKTPDHGSISWKDLVLKKITVMCTQLGDFIIQRQDGSVGYLLANMVDDALQGVTHIIRGVDGVGNTPAQIILYKSLGYDVPEFAHTPFILNEKGEKLSKRNGDASVTEWREQGYLPEAVVNCLARVGWSNGNQEFFSMNDLIDSFSLKHVSKGSGILDTKKLLHLNAMWMRHKSAAEIAESVRPFMKVKPRKVPVFNDSVLVFKSRARTLVELADLIEPVYKAPKVKFGLDEQAIAHRALEVFERTEDTGQGIIEAFSYLKPISETAPIVREALLGRTSSPPIEQVVALLGVPETVRRLKAAR